MPTRRAFLIGTGAATLLAGCGGEPPGPAIVTLAFTGGPGMNPGPDGTDRPLTISVFRLRDPGAFEAADFLALQADPAAALGGSLVGLAQVAVPPGGAANLAVTMEPEAAFLGLAGLFRDPGGKVWRVSAPIAPGTTPTGSVTLGPGGLVLSLA
ncbi:MAG: type VI secretion system lipoprotein TssJ [Amaricoccus sp.]|uniref:type VI secretion system lipoprotein TssJ n=1 Tax=Amaricoccus sp. TaxID=1872485 RepID=UPI003314E085